MIFVFRHIARTLKSDSKYLEGTCAATCRTHLDAGFASINLDSPSLRVDAHARTGELFRSAVAKAVGPEW